MRNERIIEQANYVATMAAKLAFRVESREKRRSSLDTLPNYGFFGIDGTNSATNIDRMITQLRIELLELRKMIQGV